MANCNYKVNLTDIQNKYKFNIFAMGGYNDSDLRKMIESVYYALPRVNGSGTNVTLNDTAFSYMKNKLYATDTSQYSTTGKNLFNVTNKPQTTSPNGITYKVENNVFTLSGTNTKTSAYSLVYWSNVSTLNYFNSILQKGATYTLKATNNLSGLYLQINYYKENSSSETMLVRLNDFSTSASFTIPQDFDRVTIIYIGVYGTATTINGSFSLQLEEGSSATSFEPYTNGASPNPDYPQVIHTITGDNEVVVCGKNLFDNTLKTNSRYVNKDTGELVEYSSSFATDYIEIEPNTSYYWNDAGRTNQGAFYDSSKTYVSGITTKNFTTPSNAKYVRLTGENTLLNQLQLEKGNQATTYEPYQSNSVLLTLGDKELCKIGNYEDKIFKAIKGNEVYDSLVSEEKATLDYGKWYLRKAIGKVVLNGSENWSNMQTRADGTTHYFFLQAFTPQTSITTQTTTGELCDKLTQNNPYNVVGNHFWIYKSGAYSYIRIGFADETINTKELFLTWLGNNTPTIYYPLATPTNELFNDTIQEQLEDIYFNMLSYEGQTNVSQVNDDLPFNINSTALKDLNNL